MTIDAPEILAPAGDEDCFLAALAAGADAVYLGLKHFSARMEAENFGIGQLARMLELAHAHNRRIYVAINSLIKPGEIESAWRLTCRLVAQAPVDGLIIQDPAMLVIARQAGFTGHIALSTLANVCNATELARLAALGVNRVILPRELDIDEMRQLGEACPQDLELECFVHGALCYCVSGRCYWSSYMGGRSGLRGRCAQPCRRLYARGASKKGQGSAKRYFACQDLQLAGVARALLSVPHLASWKIEGRKKGPHYVFHTVTAYRMLRDLGEDASARGAALSLLEVALGRPGVRARFLPQNFRQPMAPDGQTSSGRLAGVVRPNPAGGCVLKPHFQLLPQDYLRIGVEDERWHATMSVGQVVPKGGTLALKIPRHKTPPAGTRVFLIDRREPELRKLIGEWRQKLEKIPPIHVRDVDVKFRMPKPAQPCARPDMVVRRNPVGGRGALPRGSMAGLWLSARSAAISRTLYARTAFWLPPVVWPEGEKGFSKMLHDLWRGGARHFVLNSPWQRAFFPDRLPEDADLVAGPFCNLANAAAIIQMAAMDFSAAFASPELSGDDMRELAASSPIPMGAVLYGAWPVGLSRFGLLGLNVDEPFQSPRNELFYARNHSGTYWIYPGWKLDIRAMRQELQAAGFSFFAILDEQAPRSVPEKARPGLFNWEGRLL